MLDSALLPEWAYIDGQFFRQADLLRTKPVWWWWPKRREAWRFYRMRLHSAQREIEDKMIDPQACFAELRLFVLQGDRGALNAALEMARRAEIARVMFSGVKVGKIPALALGYQDR